MQTNKKDKKGPLRLTRVPRGAERAWELSLANNVWVYISEEDLDALCKSRPDSYLGALEQISSIIAHPDFVSFDEKQDTFHFCKCYFASGSLMPAYVKVEHRGKPQKWFFAGLFFGNKSPFYGASEQLELRRPIWKNPFIET